MSTKTLRKRVALIAVSAMGFGLLSGVSTPANAGGAPTLNSSYTVGLVSPTGNVVNGLLGTATLLSSGTLSLDLAAGLTGGTAKTVVSAGGYITAFSNETVAVDQLSATGGVDAGGRLDIKPTPGATSFTVTVYPNTTSGTAATHVIAVTVASASVAGTADAAKSYVYWSLYNASTTLGSSSVESTTANETTTGLPLYAHVRLRDAYGNAVTSTSGALVVTASTGAKVGIAGAGAAAAGSFSTAVSSADPSDISLYITEATSGAGWSGTVTVSYNGVTIATKTGKITGQVAKLEVEATKVGRNNGAISSNSFRYKASDAAGNALPLATSSVSFDAGTAGVISTAAATSASTSDTRGYGGFTCASGATGAATFTLYTTTSAGVTIKSNTVNVYCGGAPTTYTAKLDKAKYAQGDVATLTITFKDAKGALANSYDSVTTESATDASISFPMAKAINAISRTDLPNASGAIAYTFNIGDVSSFAAGKYNVVVKFATPADGVAQTVAYEVSGAGGVSNSDILASIVKLITAINKQIAALQKLLLKK